MSEDTLSAIRRVRREVVNCMRVLMRMAKQQKRTPSIATEIEASSRSKEMFEIVEEMLRKTKCLCSLMDNRFGHMVTPKLFCPPIFAKLNQGNSLSSFWNLWAP